MLVFWFLSCALSVCWAAINMQERYSWNIMDWNYPDQYSREMAVLSGALIPENALPVGIERWRNKLFVAVPRWQPGIPATLNYISLDAPYNPSPKLTPYPSWKGNELGNCETGLTTVYRMKADKCDRLWVLDTGTYGNGNLTTNPCPYALNVFDLKTHERIRRYVLRAEDIVASTFIANIAVDIGKDCEDAFAYFSDELGYGLIAYSWEMNKSWRFTHSFFMPDPLKSDFNIAGMNFQWGSEGIFGIAISPMRQDGYRTLYFSPLASHMEFAVSTKTLRDESKVSDSYRDFKIIGSRGDDGHLTAKVMSKDGVQLFNMIDQNAIGCWNAALPYKPQNLAIVEKDDTGLIFPSDVKIDDDENVWVMSDRMSIFLESQLDYSDINFRVYIAPLKTLIGGTVCEPRKTTQNYSPVMTQTKAAVPNKYTAPFTYYDTRIDMPSLPNPTYITTSTPEALLNSVNTPFTESMAPRVTSHYTLHKQPSYPYTVSKNSKTTKDTDSIYFHTFLPSRQQWQLEEEETGHLLK